MPWGNFYEDDSEHEMILATSIQLPYNYDSILLDRKYKYFVSYKYLENDI